MPYRSLLHRPNCSPSVAFCQPLSSLASLVVAKLQTWSAFLKEHRFYNQRPGNSASTLPGLSCVTSGPKISTSEKTGSLYRPPRNASRLPQPLWLSLTRSHCSLKVTLICSYFGIKSPVIQSLLETFVSLGSMNLIIRHYVRQFPNLLLTDSLGTNLIIVAGLIGLLQTLLIFLAYLRWCVAMVGLYLLARHALEFLSSYRTPREYRLATRRLTHTGRALVRTSQGIGKSSLTTVLSTSAPILLFTLLSRAVRGICTSLRDSLEPVVIYVRSPNDPCCEPSYMEYLVTIKRFLLMCFAMLTSCLFQNRTKGLVSTLTEGGLSREEFLSPEIVNLRPYLSQIQFEIEEPVPSSVISQEVLPDEVKQPAPTLRSSTMPFLTVTPYLPREDRELKDSEGVMSNLLSDDPSKIPEVLRDFAFINETFHKQRNTDSVLFSATLKKRIILSSKISNVLSFSNSAVQGAEYASAFLRIIGLDLDSFIPFDVDLFATCIKACEDKKFSKANNVLVNNDYRAEPDPQSASANHVELFIKTQLKAKPESINIQGKAGQTLSCFYDWLLMTLGPCARYLAIQVKKRLPPSVHWHNGKNLNDLDAFVKDRWVDRMSTTMDATFYDYWQGAPSLFMEQLILHVFDIPSDLIDLYVSTKCDTTVFLGVLSIMRLTGEFFTLDANTYYNVADLCVRHPEVSDQLIEGSNSLLVVGDDRTLNSELRDPASDYKYANSSPPWKYHVSRYASFVSLIVAPEGVFKDPLLMYLRLIWHDVNGDLHDVLQSYYLEHLVGLDTINNNIEILNEVQLEAHDRVCRYFTKYHSSIPTFFWARGWRLVPRYVSYSTSVTALCFIVCVTLTRRVLPTWHLSSLPLEKAGRNKLSINVLICSICTLVEDHTTPPYMSTANDNSAPIIELFDGCRLYNGSSSSVDSVSYAHVRPRAPKPVQSTKRSLYGVSAPITRPSPRSDPSDSSCQAVYDSVALIAIDYGRGGVLEPSNASGISYWTAGDLHYQPFWRVDGSAYDLADFRSRIGGKTLVGINPCNDVELLSHFGINTHIFCITTLFSTGYSHPTSHKALLVQRKLPQRGDNATARVREMYSLLPFANHSSLGIRVPHVANLA
ncbi:MAG: polyprotein [Brapardiv virus 8]|nr:MAG: polyprotein [Brapardiv virus 8]